MSGAVRSILFSALGWLVFTMPGVAQRLTVGIEAGPNVTVVTVSSPYTLAGDAIAKKPFIGYFGGLYARYTLGERGRLKAQVQYEKRTIRNSGPIVLTDAMGTFIGKFMNLKVSNNYLNVGMIYQHQPSKNFSLGAGIRTHVLLNSTTRLKGFQGPINASSIAVNNYYFKVVNVSIPLEATLYFDRFSLYLLFDKGLFNRIKDGRSNFKELENTLQLGLSFQLTPPADE